MSKSSKHNPSHHSFIVHTDLIYRIITKNVRTNDYVLGHIIFNISLMETGVSEEVDKQNTSVVVLLVVLVVTIYISVHCKLGMFINDVFKTNRCE